jgi:hypothetical protein
MNPTVSALLNLLAKLAPTIAGQAGPVGIIISEIVQALPVLVEAGVEAVAQVRDILATLQADPATDQAQLDQIEAANALVDKAFDDAAAKAEAEDAAAGQA